MKPRILTATAHPCFAFVLCAGLAASAGWMAAIGYHQDELRRAEPGFAEPTVVATVVSDEPAVVDQRAPAHEAVGHLVPVMGGKAIARRPGASALSDTYANPTLAGSLVGEQRDDGCYLRLDEQSRATAASGLRGTPGEYIDLKTTLRRPCAGLKASLEAGACIFRSDRSTYGFPDYPGLQPCE